jgi:hypothetical protein
MSGSLKVLEQTLSIQFSRLFMGLLLHMAQVDPTKIGLEQMKFAINHPYLFKKKKTAILVSWLIFFANYMVE